MIDYKQACEIAKKNDRNLTRIIFAEESNDFYHFSMAPQNWDGTKENLPIGGNTSIKVDKESGKCSEYIVPDYLDDLLAGKEFRKIEI